MLPALSLPLSVDSRFEIHSRPNLHTQEKKNSEEKIFLETTNNTHKNNYFLK